jgi:glucosamine-6-phosphate deaminase
MDSQMDVAHLEELMRVPVDELRGRARTRFTLVKDRPALIEDFARSIANEIRTNNDAGAPTRLILPVGPVAQYPILVDLCNRARISWTNVFAFNMDEFLDWQGRPIRASHPLSFEGFMRREVYARLDPEIRIPDDHCFFPHPFRIDEIAEQIDRLGGIDCCYGGIGYHGHVAFNEPPNTRWRRISLDEMRQSLTRVVVLGDDSIVVQSIESAGGNPAAIPPMAVTLGMKNILSSRKIRLYCAAGPRHRAIFRISVAGAVSTDFPSTLIQGHADAEIITDEFTAAPIEAGLH